MEEEEAEQGQTRITESVFVSGLRQKLGWKLEQGEGPGWWSHWCCCTSGGWKSGDGAAAGDADGCGGGGWRREAWEQLGAGCCVGSGGGGGSWPKWTSTWSESVVVAAEAAEGVARAEAQEEEGQRAAGPNAGPYSPG